MSDADAIVAAVAGVPAEPYKRSNEHAIHDYSLPAMARGYLAIKAGNATETGAIEEAGFMPALYATWTPEPNTIYGDKPIRVRVTMVSRLGDVGISRKDEPTGYFTRCSIYDLTDFADEMIPGAPVKRRNLRFYAIVDKKGRWIGPSPEDAGAQMKSTVVAAPDLHVERSTASKLRYDFDPMGFLGYEVVPLLINKEPE